MKVIQIVDGLTGAGGVSTFVYDLCEELVEQGAEVYLLGILKNKREPKQVEYLRTIGVQVICLGASSKRNALLRSVRQLRRILRSISQKEKVICNLHLKLSVLLGAVASIGLKNVICIETYHNSYHNYKFEYIILSPIIKRYICVSDTACTEMMERFHTPMKKIVSAPNGVNRKRIRGMIFKSMPSSTNIGNVYTFATVGRFSYEKNIHTAVAALSTLCDENNKYIVVGDGPERQKVHESAASNSSIIFTGNVPRNSVFELIYKSEAIIIPSLWEGRSIFMLEAMCFDKPLIISDAPGLREPFSIQCLSQDELFRRCSFGYVVKTESTEGYYLAAKDFIEHPEYHEGMRKTVHETSLKNDISLMVQKYLDTYKEFIV